MRSAARGWSRPDAVLQLAGVGDQNRCPHGNGDCTGPGGVGLPCSECFFDGSQGGESA